MSLCDFCFGAFLDTDIFLDNVGMVWGQSDKLTLLTGDTVSPWSHGVAMQCKCLSIQWGPSQNSPLPQHPMSPPPPNWIEKYFFHSGSPIRSPYEIRYHIPSSYCWNIVQKTESLSLSRESCALYDIILDQSTSGTPEENFVQMIMCQHNRNQNLLIQICFLIMHLLKDRYKIISLN